MSAFDFLKTQLSLLLSLVVFVGIASTDAYYSYFGLKYQLLGFATFHIVFRGVAELVTAPYLIGPYAVAVIAIYLASKGAIIGIRGVRITPIDYLLVVSGMLIVMAYPLSRIAGIEQAKMDASESSSVLPRIVTMKYGDKTIIPNDGKQYRLLLSNSGIIVYFEPVQDPEFESPKVVTRTVEGLDVLETIE